MAHTNGRDFDYTIHKTISLLGENSKYKNVLSIVSWNGYEPKYDLRRWKGEGEEQTPTKGIALTSSEMKNLKKALNDIGDFDEYMAEFGD